MSGVFLVEKEGWMESSVGVMSVMRFFFAPPPSVCVIRQLVPLTCVYTAREHELACWSQLQPCMAWIPVTAWTSRTPAGRGLEKRRIHLIALLHSILSFPSLNPTSLPEPGLPSSPSILSFLTQTTGGGQSSSLIPKHF